MNDTLAPKKRRAKPITELQAEVEAPASSGGGLEQAGGAIADQLQGLFGNQVVEAALGGGSGTGEGILSFASVLRDATEANNLGVGNAGPMGMLNASAAMDLGSKAREAAQGAMKNGVDQIMGGAQDAFGSALGGAGGDMLSGFAMRNASGGGGGFSQGAVAGNIKGSSAQSLPGALSTKLSLIMGMDMSSVRIHTDSAAAQASEALGANAFALGSDVFFNSGQFRPGTPEGDAILVEELTHVMQFTQGMLPTAPQGSGITTSNPSDAAEVQAKSVAGQMAGMLQLPVEELQKKAESIAPMMNQASQLLDGSAMRFANPFAGMLGGGEATDLRLSFNGLTITAPLPEGAEAGATIQVTLPNSIDGVTFQSCSVTLDDQKQPASGSVGLTLQVGEYVGPKQATLSIQAGGSVEASISDCPLTLGTLASGSMNCRISSDGVTGAAVVQGAQFSLGHNFTSDGGQVAVELEGGEVSGQGTLTGSVSNLGTMSLVARVAGDQLTGSADIEVEKGLQLVSGVTISQEGESRVSGTYDHAEGCQVQGQIVTDVKDFMRGTIRGGMDTAAQQWNATGLVEQTQDLAVGNVTLSGGMLQVAVENGSAGPMEGAFGLTYQEFSGSLQGTYDPATHVAAGEIEVALTGPKTLGANATLESAELTGTMAESTLETVTGSMSAKIKLKGQDTFLAALTEGTYTASSNEVSGQATIELLRNLQLPEGSSANVAILQGAMAEAQIAANEIASVETRIEWQAQDGAGMFASGDVQASFEGGAVSGEGTLNLDTNYGIPERNNEQRFVHQGASMTVTAEADQLQTISLAAVAFTVENAEGGGFLGMGSGGTIQGTVGGTYDLPTPDVTGTLSASVVNAWTIPVAFGEFSLQPGGTVTGAISANQLQTLDVGVPFQAATNSQPAVELEGNVTGTFDVPSVQFSGSATAALSANVDVDLGSGRRLRLLEGSAVSMTIDANTATSVSLISATAQYHNGRRAVAQGTVTGEMDLQAGTTTAQGSLSLLSDLELTPSSGQALEEWQVLLDEGSSLDISVVDNAPQEVSFDVSGHLKRSGQKVATGHAAGTVTLGQEQTSFSGTAQADLITKVQWHEDSRFYYLLGEQTSARATVEGSTITGAQGTFELLAAEGGTPQLSALLEASYAPGAGLSGSANIQVLQDLLVWSGGGGFFSSGDELYAIAGASSATVTVVDNALTRVAGGISLRFDPEGNPLLLGVFQVDWDPRQENGTLDGSASITTLRDYELGQVSGSGITFSLDSGGTAEATFADTTLQQFSGSLGVTVSKESDFLQATVSGAYDHTSGSVDGSGSATVTANQDVGAVYAGGKAILKEGGGASAEVAATELVRMTGNVPMQIDDDEAGTNFAEMGLQGTYDHAAKDFSGSATAQVNKEKSVGTAGDFEAFLLPDTGVSATVQTNELTEVTGSVKMRADNTEGEFAEAELSGSWTKDAGMNGTGTASLLVEEYEIANLGTFTVYVMQGTGAEMTVANNEVTSLTGQVPFQVRKGSSPFMEGHLSGTADLQNDTVSGNATVSIVQEQQLATFRETTFWVTAGSGVSVDFADNQITSIGGNLTLSLRQPDEFLQVALTNGTLDLTSETPEFSGSGSATVTREQTIFTAGTYQFAVTDETNATATLAANEITSITGTVGFRVHNDQGPLVSGAIEGSYDGTTGEVTGVGRAELEQRQDYGPIKVLPGTAGQATVNASQVERVTGRIVAELHDSEGALVSMDASGEFDAMTPELIRVEGTATLLRDLEPIPGVVISGVTGRALIENNEVREVSGTGIVTVEAIGLTGSFEANWANTGGTDEYWGSAEAGITMDHDLGGHSARGIREVRIGAELTRAGDFNVTGTAWYDITDRIGGSITIAQSGPEIDPVLSGTIDAEGDLIDGRELFKWEKTLVSGTVMAGPIPITYGVDGAMGMDMDPVSYTADVEVTNFHILQLNVPDFDAEMTLTGGANFYAKVMPYVGVGVDFGEGMFTALGGLEGQAGIDLDIDLGIGGRLKGENDSYGGELSIGASVTPSATLALVAFAEWGIFGFGDRYEFEAFSKTFDNLFQLNWETTYQFGDMGASNAAGAETTAASTPGTNTSLTQNPALADESVNPDLGVGNSTPGRSGPEGGPQISGSDQESGDQEGGQDTPSEITEAARKAEILSNGVKGLIRIVGILGTNPVSAVVDVVTNFDEVKTAVNDVIACIGLVADMIRPLLPDWWATLQEWIGRGLSVLADGIGMVLDGGRWVINTVSDALSDGWNWVSSWW